jgi:hypothetical protein
MLDVKSQERITIRIEVCGLLLKPMDCCLSTADSGRCLQEPLQKELQLVRICAYHGISLLRRQDRILQGPERHSPGSTVGVGSDVGLTLLTGDKAVLMFRHTAHSSREYCRSRTNGQNQLRTKQVVARIARLQKQLKSNNSDKLRMLKSRIVKLYRSLLPPR